MQPIEYNVIINVRLSDSDSMIIFLLQGSAGIKESVKSNSGNGITLNITGEFTIPWHNDYGDKLNNSE